MRGPSPMGSPSTRFSSQARHWNFREAKMRRPASYLSRVWFLVALAITYGAFCPVQAQQIRYEVDPSWPKPLPNRWVTGQAGGICVDAQDHIFEVNQKDLQEKETQTAQSAPSVLEYDAAGNLVNSWGDPKANPGVPESIHGCFVDKENNVWVAGSADAVVQKWTHDGSTLLMQIGNKGQFDSSMGARGGIALNVSKNLLNKPAGVAVDPTNGDVYIADGY